MAASFAKLEGLFKNHWYAVTLGILCFPFFCFMLGSLGFLVKIPLTKWHGVAALAMTVGVIGYLSPTKKVFMGRFAAFVGLQLFLLLTSSLHTDVDIDTNSYHKPAAYLLAGGWNPVWQENLHDYLSEHHITWWGHLSHARYFPKSLWIVTAVLYLMTGNISLGDYVNTAFMAALFPVALAALARWLSLRKWENVLAAALITLNPIAIRHCFSGHVDGLLGTSLAIFLLSALMWLKTDQRRWIPLLMIPAIFGCLLKHSAPIYFGAIGAVYSLPVLWKCLQSWRGKPAVVKQWMRVSFRGWFAVMFGIFFAVLVLGFHPYVTNTWYHSSPFYPLHSFNQQLHPVEKPMDVCYAIDEFRDASTLQRFIFSHLLTMQSWTGEEAVYAYPISKIGLLPNQPDASFSGFTWIFSMAFATSLGLLFFVRGTDRWLILTAIVLSIVTQPHSWWARLIPQLWLFPILIFCFILSDVRLNTWVGTRIRWLLGIQVGLLLILIAYCLGDTSITMLNRVQLEREQETYIRENPDGVLIACIPEGQGWSVQPMFHFFTKMKFRDAGIEVEVISDKNHPGLEELIGRGEIYSWFALYCLPDAEYSPKTYDEVAVENRGASKSKIPASLWQTAKLRAWQLKKAWIGE